MAIDRPSCVGAACSDGSVAADVIDSGADAMDMDGTVEDGGDGGAASDANADAPSGEVSVVVGRCTGVMAAPIVLGEEPRQQARRVFVGQNAGGWFAGYTIQDGGADVARFHRISNAGASSGALDLAPDFLGARIGGGAFTAVPTGFASVFHSNANGGLDIYLQRVDSAGAARSGSVVRVNTDTEISEDPMVLRTSRGEVVLWRSTMDMLGGQRLLSSLVNGAAPSAPVSVGPTMTQAASFDAVTDGTRVAVALVARNELGQGNLFVQVLDGGGALTRSIPLTMGAFITDAVAISYLGTDVVVAWTLRGADGTFRLRRVNLDTGMAGPETVISGFGYEVSQTALAADRDGLVAAMRTSTPMGPRVAVARIGPALTLREGLSSIAESGPGDQVRIVGRGDGTFGVAWADENPSPMRTTVKFQLVRCP